MIQADACLELRAFAEHTHIPVVTTLHGLGAFPLDHPLALGMPGMHGWVHVNRAIQACDVLLNIGSRFDDRVTGKAATFAPRARIIHVDCDAASIGKVVRADVAIVADARAALAALRSEVKPVDTHEWLASIRALEATHKPRQAYLRRDRSAPLMPHDVYDAMNDAFAGRVDWRVVTDVGQHQMWAAQLLEWRRPRTHITSGGAGTMGFAIPAALGVAMACPNDTVWAVVGDGGFQMTNQELATIAQEGVRNVKIAVINNGYLGMVRQWQELFENRRYSGTPLSGPDFARLAEAYGLTRVHRPRRCGRPPRGRRRVDAPRLRGHRLPGRARSQRVPHGARGPLHRRDARRRSDRITPTRFTDAIMTRHTLLVHLQDKPGALHRTVTLFRRRSYNISSLHVERSETAGISHMTVSIEAPDSTQVIKELDRLVDVLGVRDMTTNPDQGWDGHPRARAQADGLSDEGDVA